MPCLISGNSEVEFQTKSDLFVIGDVEIVSSDSYFQHIWPCSHAKPQLHSGKGDTAHTPWRQDGPPGVHRLKVTPVYPEPKKSSQQKFQLWPWNHRDATPSDGSKTWTKLFKSRTLIKPWMVQCFFSTCGKPWGGLKPGRYVNFTYKFHITEL